MPVVRGGEFFDFSSIQNANGKPIPLGYFRDARAAAISAVVFSPVATWGKVRVLSADPNPHVGVEMLRYNAFGPAPIHQALWKRDYVEPLLDGLHVFHNPHATHPLPLDVFHSLGVAQETIPAGETDPIVHSTHGTLIQRTVLTLTTFPSTNAPPREGRNDEESA